MHDERRVATERFISTCSGLTAMIRRLPAREVGDVMSHPLTFRFIPPDECLLLAPRFSIRISRRAVVQNPAVERPRVSPAVSVPSFRLAAVGAIHFIEHTRIDPAAARGGSICAEVAEMTHR